MGYSLLLGKKTTWRLELNLRTVRGRAIMCEILGLPSEAEVEIEIATDTDGQEYVHSVKEHIPETVGPKEVKDGFWIVDGQWVNWSPKWISEIHTCESEYFRKQEDGRLTRHQEN